MGLFPIKISSQLKREMDSKVSKEHLGMWIKESLPFCPQTVVIIAGAWIPMIKGLN